MTTRLTPEAFRAVFPGAKSFWVDTINDHIDAFAVNTPDRLCAFVSQCGHESGGFTVFTENLNYSASSLVRVFKKYFPDMATAGRYARKPELIANRVYANRMGNGNEASGDGWKYRGRGLIQLTGKANYKSFSSAVSVPSVMDDPDTVAEPDLAVLSALWFWDTRKLNAPADAQNIKRVTTLINGGLNGYEDRVRLYKKLRSFYD